MLRAFCTLSVASVCFVLSDQTSVRPRADWPGVFRSAFRTIIHGSDEDPNARTRYEWLRFHDAATGRIPQGVTRNRSHGSSTTPLPRSNPDINGISNGTTTLDGVTPTATVEQTES